MKKTIYILLSLLILSCSSGQKNDDKETKAQITEKQQEIKKLQNEVKELQSKLNTEEESQGYIEPVSIKTIKPENFKHYFNVSGNVEAVNQAMISPEATGRIKSITVKEGQVVRKGQILAYLDNSVLKNTIDEVQTQLNLANTIFERQDRLWKKKIGSEVQYLQAKNNKESLEKKLQTLNAQIDMSVIKAPISGIIETINQKNGEYASPVMVMMQIVNLSRMKITADISESYLPVIHKGMIVNVSFPTYPELMLSEAINRVGNVVSTSNRSFEIEVDFNNVDGNLIKPNIIGEIKINDYSDDSAFVVPANVIRQDPKGYYVYIASNVNGKNIATKAYVKPGLSYNNNITILNGLKANQNVIINGFANVSDGSQIKIVNN